jgi:putative endonuclease
MSYYFYIMANTKFGTLYCGVTGDIVKRVHQHKSGLIDGFTKKYRVHKLVLYEIYVDIHEAITREKHVKNGTGIGS